MKSAKAPPGTVIFCESESQDLLDFVSGTKAFVYIMLVVGMALGLGLAWAVSLMITTPLQAAVDAMKDVSEGEGDLTMRLTVSGKDEIGQLASSFNGFITKMQNVIREVTASTSQLSAALAEKAVRDIRRKTRRKHAGVIKVRIKPDHII